MLVCCYPYDHPCFSWQLTLSVYIDCSRAYSVFLTDLFSFASFLPFPPQVLREGILELSLDFGLLACGISAHVRFRHEASYGYHLFGDSTYVFQFFSWCCFYLDLFIWKVDIMLYQTCFEMVWNLPLFFLCYLLCLHIYICSCSALIYHYACLPDSNAPPKS